MKKIIEIILILLLFVSHIFGGEYENYFCAKDTYLYEKPEINSKKICQLKRGEFFNKVKQTKIFEDIGCFDDGWLQIELKGQIGYAYGGYIYPVLYKDTNYEEYFKRFDFVVYIDNYRDWDGQWVDKLIPNFTIKYNIYSLDKNNFQLSVSAYYSPLPGITQTYSGKPVSGKNIYKINNFKKVNNTYELYENDRHVMTIESKDTKKGKQLQVLKFSGDFVLKDTIEGKEVLFTSEQFKKSKIFIKSPE